MKNELQHLSLNKGMQRKRKLWSQAGQQLLRDLPLKKMGGVPGELRAGRDDGPSPRMETC